MSFLLKQNGYIVRKDGKIVRAKSDDCNCCGDEEEEIFTCNSCGGCCFSTASKVRVPAFSWADDGVRTGWTADDIAFFNATQSMAEQVLPFGACEDPANALYWGREATIAGFNVNIRIYRFWNQFNQGWALSVVDTGHQNRKFATRLGVYGDCCGTTNSLVDQYVEWDGDFGSSNDWDAFNGGNGKWQVENNKCCHCEDQTFPFNPCVKSTKDYCPSDGDNECDTIADIDTCEAGI